MWVEQELWGSQRPREGSLAFREESKFAVGESMLALGESTHLSGESKSGLMVSNLTSGERTANWIGIFLGTCLGKTES